MKQWLVRQFRTFASVYNWWRDQLTPMGKVISVAMICALPTLADLDAIWAIVFIASMVVLLVTNFASFLYRPRLVIRATCPEPWMRTESRILSLEISNRARWPVYDLQIELLPTDGIWAIEQPPLFVAVLKPRETIRVRVAVRALRRGRFKLPQLRATTLFPLQLVRRRETISLGQSAIILPFYKPLRSFRLTRSAPNLTRGTALAFHTIGMNGEYVGSREYQPGIPVRKWDYPSWARLGQPVVREYCDPRYPSAAVILDTHFDTHFDTADPPSADPIPELEAILSLAAAITGWLLARGHGIELLVIGDQLFFIDSTTAYGNHRAILDYLALAQPTHADTFAPVVDQIEQLPITWDLAFVVSHHWEPQQEELFQAVTRHRAVGKRIIVNADGKTGLQWQQERTCQVTCSEIAAGMVDL